jgi:hypothetical protein
MPPTGDQPAPKDLESLLDDEERRILDDPDVSAEEKAELIGRIERFRDTHEEQPPDA